MARLNIPDTSLTLTYEEVSLVYSMFFREWVYQAYDAAPGKARNERLAEIESIMDKIGCLDNFPKPGRNARDYVPSKLVGQY